MLHTTIYADVKELNRRLGILKDRSGAVVARAANRSYKVGKSAIAKEAKKDYRVKQKDVNNDKTLKIKKATQNDPFVSMKYTGEHRNLYLWDGKKAVSPDLVIHWSHGKPNVNHYKAAVMRGHARIKFYGKNQPFIQHVRKGENSDFVGLFRRKSEDRDAKLIGVGAPAIPQILRNEKIMESFERETIPMFQKRLEHEIDNVLKGITK